MIVRLRSPIVWVKERQYQNLFNYGIGRLRSAPETGELADQKV
jgi:hypothetical protein